MQNKPSRIEKIQQLLEETSVVEKVDKRHAQVVHGNLNFALSFFLGKTPFGSCAGVCTPDHRRSKSHR